MHNLVSFSIFFCFCISILKAQQEYSGNDVLDCVYENSTVPSPSYLYTCNGQRSPCRAYLIFKSQTNYNSVAAISNLTSSDPSELALINKVARNETIPIDKEVIVPVKCSCSGQYYQANSSYAIIHSSDTYYTIANITYQGLSSCSSLMGENPYPPEGLWLGLKLQVPLRCACPTRNQTAQGIKYLLTYSICYGDDIPHIAQRFNVSSQQIHIANGFSEPDPEIYPFTTILIPLMREPSSSQTVIDSPPPPPPLPPPSPPLPPPPSLHNLEHRKPKVRLLVGVNIGGAASFLTITTILGILFVRHKKNKKRVKVAEGKNKWVLPKEVAAGISGVDYSLTEFSVEALMEATDNFSSERKIGGSVYCGVVAGRVSAIKVMCKDVSSEANILHKLNHFNLIRLYGTCIGQEHRYLIYEFMENGSLKSWLHETNNSRPWSWSQRVQIALDVAIGLDYLHNFTEPPYVHMGIKSSNVLLDDNLRAKIANFGLARSAEKREGGFASTPDIEGTLGYMAPEYFESGLVTPKLDVYAFGVVMLELITGKDAITKYEGKEALLSTAVISIMEGGNEDVELRNFVNSAMRSSSYMDLAMSMARLSVACLRLDPESRPSMEEVVTILSRMQIGSQSRGV